MVTDRLVDLQAPDVRLGVMLGGVAGFWVAGWQCGRPSVRQSGYRAASSLLWGRGGRVPAGPRHSTEARREGGWMTPLLRARPDGTALLGDGTRWLAEQDLACRDEAPQRPRGRMLPSSSRTCFTGASCWACRRARGVLLSGRTPSDERAQSKRSNG